jgi:flagellar protein FlaI
MSDADIRGKSFFNTFFHVFRDQLEKKSAILQSMKDDRTRKVAETPPSGYILLEPGLYPLTVREGICYNRMLYDQVDGRTAYEVLEIPPPVSYDSFVSLLFKRYALLNWDETTLKSIAVSEGFEDPEGLLVYHVLKNFKGLGRIEPFWADENIEEVSYGGYGVEGSFSGNIVYVYQRNYGWVPTNVSFRSDEEVEGLIRMWARKLGHEINNAKPMGKFQLEDGSRIEARITRAVSPLGANFTIRRFRPTPLTYLDMIASGVATPSIYAYLWFAMQNKSNIAIVGGTAAGKTTFLGSLLLFLPQRFKVVTLEDTRELNMDRHNWNAMVTRPAMIGLGRKSVGEDIDMKFLLMASLRQRPDYLIVGEVRGVETFDMVQAMATGQKTLTTFHADDIDSFISRLTSPPLNVARDLLSSVHLVVFVRNIGGNKRRVVSIYESYLKDGVLKFDPAMTLENGEPVFKVDASSPTVKRISQEIGKDSMYIMRELGERTKFLQDLTPENWRRKVWDYA